MWLVLLMLGFLGIGNGSLTPVLSSADITSKPTGTTDTLVTFTGSGFQRGMVIVFNGTRLAADVTSSTSCTATVTTALMANAGSFPFWAANGLEQSNSLVFTVTANPIISGVSPSTVTAGAGDTPVTIGGIGFINPSTVHIGATNLGTAGYTSSTQLTITIPAANLVTAGSFPITVVGATGSAAFAVQAAPFSHDDSVYAPQGYETTCALDLTKTVFNVTSAPYSADNTGATDATPGIQAAIDAAVAAGGGIIYFPTGTYAVCPQQTFSAYGSGTNGFRTTRYAITGIATGVITSVTNSLITGQILHFTSATSSDGGCTPAVMSANGTFALHTTAYYVNKLTSTTFKLYDTLAHAQAGGSTGLITFSNAGANLAFGDEPVGPCFNITANVPLIFIGDGAGPLRGTGDGTGTPGPTDSRGELSKIKVYCHNLNDPATNWCAGVYNGSTAAWRSSFIRIAADDAGHNITGVQVRSLSIDGQTPYGTSHNPPANSVTGDGWDTQHKGIWIDSASHTTNLLVFNCLIKNWRGEQIYGNTQLGTVTEIQCQHKTANSSAVSVGANYVARYNYYGGPNVGDDLANGTENFYYGGPTQSIKYCNMQRGANGFVVLSPYGSTTEISHNAIDSCGSNAGGIFLSEFSDGVTIDHNIFTNCSTSANITANILGQYGAPFNAYNGHRNITISNNNHSAGTRWAIYPQANGTTTAFDWTGWTMTGDSISAGTYLVGGFGGSALGTWTGFAVTNLTIQSGADVALANSQGPQVALWSGTTRNGTKYNTALQQVGTSTLTCKLLSDLTVLYSNSGGGGGCLVDYDSTKLAGLPNGFTTTFHGVFNTWTIKANSAWNTLGADLPLTNGDGGEVTFVKTGGKLVKQ
jgi:hypothetical protein